MSKRMFGRLFQITGLLIIATFAVTWVAMADDISNNLDVSVDATLEVMNLEVGGTNGTTLLLVTPRNSDGKNGCNLTGDSTLVVNVNSNDTAVATVSPSEVTFASCDDTPAISVTPIGQGSATISLTQVSNSTDGTFNLGPASFTVNVAAAEVLDTTPPVITPNVVGTLGDNDWYTSDVELTWTVVDDESDITSTTGCETVNITTDQAATSYTCEATSAGGTSSESVTIKRDATAPAVNPSVSPNPVVMNGSATANPGASDVLSGVASSSCNVVDTSTVGAKTVQCTATDNAGNMNSGSATYQVNYGFVGFGKPVDNGPVMNVAKAGQAIPLKFRVVDANGVGVTNLAAVKVTVASLSCSAGTTADAVEEYAAGSSGLQNLGDGYYQFNWKTPTNYVNSCKTMMLDLNGGGSHTASFQFKK